MSELVPSKSRWLALDFHGPADEADSIVEMCWTLGTSGIQESSPRAARLDIRAYFENQSLNSLLSSVQEELTSRGSEASVEATNVDFDPEEWLRQFKSEFTAFPVEPDYYIRPSWDQPDPSYRFNIEIEPGHAFGTGTHESTQLMLQLLATLDPLPESILDVGTGSAILAIAAAQRNPGSRILAIDNDPMAVESAEENLRRNRIHQVDLMVGGPESVGKRFDLVLANLTQNIFSRLAPALESCVGERLIVSGFTSRQSDLVTHNFPSLDVTRRAVKRGWEGLVLRRPR